VLGSQVAVPVANEPCVPTPVQDGQRTLHDRHQKFEPVAGRRPVELLDIGQVSLGLAFPPPCLPTSNAGHSTSVKSSDRPGGLVDVALAESSRGQERSHRGALVIATHLHGVVDRSRCVRRDPDVILPAHDRPDAEIDVRRELAVDANLFSTSIEPRLLRAVVEEREFHRLLDLQRPVTGQYDPRAMRFS